MKIRHLLCLAGLAAAAALPAAEPETPLPAVAGRQWLDHYYQNPRPQDFLTAVHSLSASGYLDDASRTPTAIGFFATMFAAHPQKAGLWLARTRELPEAHRRLLASAAWMAGHTQGARLLRELSAGADDATRTEIATLLAAGPRAVADTPVRSESSLALHWGAFLASGEERSVIAIIDAIGANEPGLQRSALVALARVAAEHPRVLAICQRQLDQQPAHVREMLQTALAESAAKPGA